MINSEERPSLLCLYTAIFLFYKYNRMQSKHKQNVNIADETLTDYSFLRRYHYTKSKNYLKRRYRIRHWISMFIGKLCTQDLCTLDIYRCRNPYFSYILYVTIWSIPITPIPFGPWSLSYTAKATDYTHWLQTKFGY